MSKTIDDFGLMSRRVLNMFGFLSFLVIVAAAEIFFTHASEAASPWIFVSPEGNYNLCLDDSGSGTTNGNKVDIWPCNGTEAQEWTYNSNHTITDFGKCLDVYQQGTANGTKVDLYQCNGGSNQYWTYTGSDTLVSKQSGDCLDDPQGSTTKGTQLQIWACNGNTQQYWYYETSPTPPPATPVPPTPRPTVNPTPTPVVPVSNPAPAPGGGTGGGSGGSGGGSGGDTSAAATPTTPGNFTATAASDNAVINLSWTASSDAAGITGYQLERSIDNATWTVLSSDITDVTYSDTGVDFGVHYYYRIKALDANGNASAYATADAITANFVGTATSTSGSTSYTSSDGLVTVMLPDGAVDGSVDCSVTPDPATNFATGQRKVVAGPYELLCKDANGNTVTSFSQALAWSVNLKNRLKGVTKPTAYTAGSSNNLSAITNAKFNRSSQVMTFTTTTANDVLVLATVTHGVPWNLVVIILVVLGVMGGVAVIILRRRQKLNYDEYLRTKYYNL